MFETHEELGVLKCIFDVNKDAKIVLIVAEFTG
jgi:hypothetical protein